MKEHYLYHVVMEYDCRGNEALILKLQFLISADKLSNRSLHIDFDYSVYMIKIQGYSGYVHVQYVAFPQAIPRKADYIAGLHSWKDGCMMKYLERYIFQRERDIYLQRKEIFLYQCKNEIYL